MLLRYPQGDGSTLRDHPLRSNYRVSREKQ